mmetsp:Transcript_12338/g.17157  ORF Transcript_12338/g.17157 Transcript_12338/m.17157 type:complete len:117 (+) Transcript_12338:1008-1358(+)
MFYAVDGFDLRKRCASSLNTFLVHFEGQNKNYLFQIVVRIVFCMLFVASNDVKVGCLMVADEDGASVHVLACGKDGFGRDSQVAIDFRSLTAYASFLDYNGGVDNMRHALGVFDLY